MDFIVILIPIAILLGSGFAVAFVWAVRQGQFDDLDDPARRMLQDDADGR